LLAEQRLALARSTGNKLWTAECLNGLSWLHSNLGRPGRGLVYGEQAIALYQRPDAPWQRPQCWDSAGYALHRLGRYEEAAARREMPRGVRKTGVSSHDYLFSADAREVIDAELVGSRRERPDPVVPVGSEGPTRSRRRGAPRGGHEDVPGAGGMGRQAARQGDDKVWRRGPAEC
jgi:hypothetical protein